jgi:hypothetical protein
MKLGSESEQPLVEITLEAIYCGVPKAQLRGIIFRAACLIGDEKFATTKADRIMKAAEGKARTS